MATISWYAIGLIVAVLTPSVLYLWNGCCGSVYHGIHSWFFMRVAERFQVEEHRFDNVSNLSAMSRVLRQAGLRTGRHRWVDHANVDANDSYEVGTVHFPTKSYCPWILALLGITWPAFVRSWAAPGLFWMPLRRLLALPWKPPLLILGTVSHKGVRRSCEMWIGDAKISW